VLILELLSLLALVYLLYKALRYVFSSPAAKVASDWLAKMCGIVVEFLGNRYRLDWPATTFLINRNFVARTLLNFKVEYQLRVTVERVNPEEYRKHRMRQQSSRDHLVEVFNEQVVEPYLEKQSCFFKIEWRTPVALEQVWQPFRTALMQLHGENDQWLLREVPAKELEKAVLKSRFRSHGCKLTHIFFKCPRISESLIKENYNMLSEEQKTALLLDERFGAYEEMLAIAAMRRQLDFFEEPKQEYDAVAYKLEVERTGRMVKLKWTIHDSVNIEDYHLLGFRNTGGFSKDQLSEDGNGQRIVDAWRSGETTEVLNDDESYFYTFFLKRWDVTRKRPKCNSLRFQLTTAVTKQAKAIRSALERIERRKKTLPPDPEKENLTKALKELGGYVEMDTAFEAMEKSFIDQIGKSSYSEADKQRKIERLQDIVRQIRSKYEP
jgi:hypothetical protein